MKKIGLITIIVSLCLGRLFAATVFEGAAQVDSSGTVPAGLHMAAKALQPNTWFLVTNLETGASVKLMVSSSLDNGGILALLSPDAAQALGFGSRTSGRIRIESLPDSEAYSSYSSGGTASGSGTPAPASVAAASPGKAKAPAPANSAPTIPALTPPLPSASAAQAPAAPAKAASSSAAASKQENTPNAAQLAAPAPSAAPETPSMTIVPAVPAAPSGNTPETAPEPVMENNAPGSASKPPVSAPVPAPVLSEAANTPASTASKPAVEPSTPAENPASMTLVPSTMRPPNAAEAGAGQKPQTAAAEKQAASAAEPNLPVAHNPSVPAPSATVASAAPPAKPASVIPPSKGETFSVPVITSLEPGMSYLQMGSYHYPTMIESELTRIGRTYPLVIEKSGDGPSLLYKILIGPMSEGEAQALKTQMLAQGYQGVFIRR
jgi:hypothetical protein